MTVSLSGGYDYLSPPRIVFGWGRRSEAGALASSLGRRAFVVHGSRTLERAGLLDALCDSLRASGVEPVLLEGIRREPEVEDVDRASREVRRRGPGEGDLVLGIGGGAALDLAKAVSAMAVQDESNTVEDYLEGVGKGLRLKTAPLPVLAMPTTSGTGSEATKNAVVSGGAPGFKKSLRSDLMIPRIALVDPQLSVSVPPTTTAHTGMDALTQLVESYISCRARPLPQALAIDGIRTVAPALVRAVRDGEDREAREAMAHGALSSGLALANSGLGLAHGVAAALGIRCRVPHGLACAVLLPTALRVNLEVRCREIGLVGEILCGRKFASEELAAEAACERVEELCSEVGIPRTLGALGVARDDIPFLVKGSRGNSMSGNPRELSDDELRALLESLL